VTSIPQFIIRLSRRFSIDDCEFDIELPEVPAVGDMVRVQMGRDEFNYRVLARQFRVSVNDRAEQHPRNLVLLHVETI